MGPSPSKTRKIVEFLQEARRRGLATPRQILVITGSDHAKDTLQEMLDLMTDISEFSETKIITASKFCSQFVSKCLGDRAPRNQYKGRDLFIVRELQKMAVKIHRLGKEYQPEQSKLGKGLSDFFGRLEHSQVTPAELRTLCEAAKDDPEFAEQGPVKKGKINKEDLAPIWKAYEHYVRRTRQAKVCFSGFDAIACELLQPDASSETAPPPSLSVSQWDIPLSAREFAAAERRANRMDHRLVILDDAEDLSPSQLSFFSQLFGKEQHEHEEDGEGPRLVVIGDTRLASRGFLSALVPQKEAKPKGRKKKSAAPPEVPPHQQPTAFLSKHPGFLSSLRSVPRLDAALGGGTAEGEATAAVGGDVLTPTAALQFAEFQTFDEEMDNLAKSILSIERKKKSDRISEPRILSHALLPPPPVGPTADPRSPPMIAVLLTNKNDVARVHRALEVRGILSESSVSVPLSQVPEVARVLAFLRVANARHRRPVSKIKTKREPDSTCVETLIKTGFFNISDSDADEIVAQYYKTAAAEGQEESEEAAEGEDAEAAEQGSKLLYDVLVELSQQKENRLWKAANNVLVRLDQVYDESNEMSAKQLIAKHYLPSCPKDSPPHYIMRPGSANSLPVPPASHHQDHVFYNLSKFWRLLDDVIAGVGGRDMAMHVLANLERDAALESSISPAWDPTNPNHPCPRVMTLHGAKGRLFDHVFVPLAVDLRLPGRNISQAIPLSVVESDDGRRSLVAVDKEKADHERDAYRVLMTALCSAACTATLTSCREVNASAKKERKPSAFVKKIFGEDIAQGPPPSLPTHHSSPTDQTATPKRRPPANVTRPLNATTESLNFTAIENYLSCPRKYFYSKAGAGTDTVHFMRGRVVHRVIERALTEKRAHGNLPPLSSLEAHVRDQWSDKCLTDKTDNERALQETLDMVKRWHGRELLSPRVAMSVEADFSVDVQSTLVTGKIDRIDFEKEGYIITDFKTGQSQYATDLPLQLHMYAYALEKKTGARPVELALEFVRDGKVAKFEHRDEHNQLVEKTVEQVASAIRAQKFDPTPSPKACKFCNFANSCEYKKLV